jgi:hypothetical protein
MGLSTQQIDLLKNTCLSSFKKKDYKVYLDVSISEEIRWRPHIYAKDHEEFILDILTTEDLPKSQIDKYIDIKNKFPDMKIYLAIVGDVPYSYSGAIEQCSRYGIGIYVINGDNLHLLLTAKAPTIEQIRSEQDTVIAPDQPYGNILALKKCFRQCTEYVYWLEKNLPKKVFEILYEAVRDGDISGVGEIKLLRTFDQSVDDRFRAEAERLRAELVNYDINLEVRIICNKSISTSIHGRFIYTKNRQFQIPPLNSLLANQWDNIFHGGKTPPFEDLWKRGLDIISQWNDVK